MAIAMRDLDLQRLDVIWPGKGSWSMGRGIRAVGIEDLLDGGGGPGNEG